MHIIIKFDIAAYTHFWTPDSTANGTTAIIKGVHKTFPLNGTETPMLRKVIYRMEQSPNGRFQKFDSSFHSNVERHVPDINALTSSVTCMVAEQIDEMHKESIGNVVLRTNPSNTTEENFKAAADVLIGRNKTLYLKTFSGYYYRYLSPTPEARKRKAPEADEEERKAKRKSPPPAKTCLLKKLHNWAMATWEDRYGNHEECNDDEEDDNTFIRCIQQDPSCYGQYFECPEDYLRALQHYNVVKDGKVVVREIEDYRPEKTFEKSRTMLARALAYCGRTNDTFYSPVNNNRKVKEHRPSHEDVGPAGDFLKDPGSFVLYFKTKEDLSKALEAIREEDLSNQ